ncbi:MAG: metalloregulator ArsR/SmtB family transcription factor [Bacteroidota bacterium]
MGLTKTEIFTKEQNHLANIAKVLGHPARIAILQHLLAIDRCVCGDLVEVIGLAQPTISQHLKELKRIGLVQGNIEGTSVCYCIDKTVWKQVAQTLTALFTQLKVSESNCC